MAIKTACTHCEREYTLADDMLGKKVRCKDCGEMFAVRDGDDREDDIMTSEDRSRKRSLAAARSRGDDDDDRSHRGRDEDDEDRPRRSREDDEDDDRPRRKSRKSGGSGLVIGLSIGGGLLLIGGVVLAIVLLSGGGSLTPENLAKIKKDMTEKEVLALIGSPTEKEEAKNDPLFGNVKGMKWKAKDIDYAILFKDDKVVFWGGQVGTAMWLNGQKMDMNGVANLDPNMGNPFGNQQNPFGNQQNPFGDPQNQGDNNPKADARLTAENVYKIRKGMDDGELKVILGKPTSQREERTPEGKHIYYMTYAKPGINVTFEVSIGRVDSMSGNVNGNPNFPDFAKAVTNPGPQGGDPRWTADNVQKLRKGMTEQQVTGILGPATSAIEPPQGFPGPKQLIYFGGPLQVTVSISNGKADALTGFVSGQFVNATAFNQGGNTGVVGNPNPNPGTAALDPKQIQPNMTEQQLTTQFGQPLSAVDIPGQQAQAKGVNGNDVKQFNGTFKPIRALLYNRGDGQQGKIEVIVVDGRVYRYNLLK
jgi:outer membrane protein assembly factor BamE (lipoprotein component of BamABCDE complex)